MPSWPRWDRAGCRVRTRRNGDPDPSRGGVTESAEFLAALRPVVESLGAGVVPVEAARPGDSTDSWRGETVAYHRPVGAPSEYSSGSSRSSSGRSATAWSTTREQKQVAVRRLDEQGAFLLRGAVEDVANWMGVSKVTLYSYLNIIGRR